MKQTIQTIYAACGKEYPTEDSTLEVINFLSELIDENHKLEAPDEAMHYCDLFDAIETLESKWGDDDFYFEYDGNEYRIISEDAIWDIYVDEIKSTVEDCYDLNLDKMPSFIAFEIDWEQTAKNCYFDGYGHQFSVYDHSELTIGDYWVFRVN